MAGYRCAQCSGRQRRASPFDGIARHAGQIHDRYVRVLVVLDTATQAARQRGGRQQMVIDVVAAEQRFRFVQRHYFERLAAVRAAAVANAAAATAPIVGLVFGHLEAGMGRGEGYYSEEVVR